MIGTEQILLEFNDILIEPIFSNVRSRKDVDLSSKFLGLDLSLPLINSNMDTVSSPELCKVLGAYGTIGTLHRFYSIEENVKAFVDSVAPETKGIGPIVSIGIGDKEFERAKALHNVGASRFILDVAHAANIAVIEMYNKLVKEFPFCYFVVGDFGTGKEIEEFLKRVNRKPDAIKAGIGIGSVCETRLVTGVGNTALSCLLDCSPICEENEISLILDGGVTHYGDIGKALIAGADLVMSGSLFSGCEESPGTLIVDKEGKNWKSYRGSASQESYIVQNKLANWRAAEGKSILVPVKGSAITILNAINGGLRSTLSYTNAFNLHELKVNGKFTFVK